MLFRNPRRPSLLAPQHSADSFCCTLILLAAEVSGVRSITITAARYAALPLLEDFSRVRHADAGRDGGVRLATRRQPPATAIILRSATTLPDCSVTLGLSSNCSPFSVAFVISHGKYPIYSHISMSRSSIIVRARVFDLSCSWFGPVRICYTLAYRTIV